MTEGAGAKAKGLLAAVLVLLLLAFCSCAGGCGPQSADEPSAPTAASSKENAVPAERYGGTPAIPYTESDEAQRPDAGESAPVEEGGLRVRFLDVGQGDAALISCGGEHLLIDGGPASASSKLYSILDRLGIERLDYVIATHPDADHCGGIAGALNRAACGTFFCSVDHHDTKTFNNILKYLGDTSVTIPQYGDGFSLGGAEVRFVGPVKKAADTNNGSLVCKVTFGETSFLFTGDAETASEAQMLRAGADLDADVLKVGHHGSDSSSSREFLESVSPRYAVVSVGSNSYGHPDPAVLDALEQCGAQIYRTDQQGDVVFESDGHNLQVECIKGRIEA